MPFADKQGVGIHYRVEGKGPSLLLVHGFFGSLQRWYAEGYVDVLKDRYQLVLLVKSGKS